VESTGGSKNTVAIIDQLAAEKLWRGGNALGKHLHIDKKMPDAEIVGVVGNTRENIAGQSTQPHLFARFGREYEADVHFHIKAAGVSLATIRREILAADARLPLIALKTMRGHLDSSFDIWIAHDGRAVRLLCAG
jgi:hypothetical protein